MAFLELTRALYAAAHRIRDGVYSDIVRAES